MRRRARSREQAPPERSCGECRACCITLGFQQREGEAPFEKPHGVPCPHLIQIGCGIYNERPPVCRRFECGWLQAPNLPDALRPDRCGVLFCVNDRPDAEGYAVYAYELRPGAVDAPLPVWLLGELAGQLPLLIVRHDGHVQSVPGRPSGVSGRGKRSQTPATRGPRPGTRSRRRTG
jgi:hypothetical protein